MVSAKVAVAAVVVVLSISAIVVAEQELIFGPGEGTVALDANGYGQVSGGGTYKRGTEITLSAVGSGGQEFYKWSDGNTEPVRTFKVTGNTALTAYFAFMHKLNVTYEFPDRGTVSGHGTHVENTTATLTAMPKYGYCFASWKENGRILSNSATVDIQMNSDRNLVVVFDKMKFTLTIGANYVNAGIPSGAGTYYYLDEVQLNAHPASGYEFEGWYDGQRMISGERNFRHSVEGNKTITAKYGIIHDATFTLSSDPYAGVTFSCIPKYNVEVVSRQWLTFDYSGSQITPTSSGLGTGGRYNAMFSEPKRVSIIAQVEYTDGQKASHTVSTIVDKTYTKRFTWDYTYGYVQSHQLLWGLVTWNTNEVARKTMEMNCNVTFSQYTAYREAIKPVNGWRSGDYARFVTYTDPLIMQLASNFSSVTANLTSLERAQFALNFVSCAITYMTDEQSTGCMEYFKFPYETLSEKVGDCEDTAFLYASLMKAMGYKVVVFGLPGHAMVGISVPGATGYYMDYGGVRYFFCETTGEPGSIYGIGQLDISYRNVNVTVHPIP